MAPLFMVREAKTIVRSHVNVSFNGPQRESKLTRKNIDHANPIRDQGATSDTHFKIRP